jgi:protein involved in polysaccharide export with SLBB domain
VVFVPVRETQVKVIGRVVRPGIYELKPGETLPDLIAAAGGFEPDALRRRVQIDRILPPRQRGPSGRDRVVIDLPADQFESENDPPLPLEPGDSVTVFAVADRRRDMISVWGPVWTQGPIGFSTGMHLSGAIRLAGGPKPEVYHGLIQVSRLLPDSSRIELHSSLRDSTGAVTEDLPLVEDDSITLFSRTEFRPLRYVAVTGAVHNAGRVDFHEGMTLRDALLEVGGLTEDALLTEVEIARLPDDTARAHGRVAETLRVPLDSSYVFERAPDGHYVGPPGLPAPASGAQDAVLRPYDNVLVLRQPDWEFQRTVAITGQVRYPGRYGLLKRTDRLTDLVQRAGGLTREAYPEGIQLYRSQDRTGRIGVNLARALKDSSDRDNLILAGGDSIFIPEYNPVVMVNGLVNAPQAVNYNPGKDIEYYISGAGGYHRNADKGRAYVTQPSGKVQSVHRRFLLPDSKPQPLPGATVFVPIKDTTFRHDWVALIGPIVQVLASVTTIIVVLHK